jgi:hypothetical protein
MYQPEYFEEHRIIGDPPARLPGNPGAPLLFNLREDPLEQRDLAGAQPDRVHRMSRAVESWFEAVERERASIVDDDAARPLPETAAARAVRNR